jgi:TorA maturation chaperone TorD
MFGIGSRVMDNQELSLAFKVLSSFFAQKVDIEQLREKKLLDGWFILSPNPSNTKGKEALASCLLSDKKNDVYADFTALFLSNEERLLANPYASYYLDKNGEIYSDESDDVEKIYEKCGFTPTYAKSPSDHIANEFEFVAYMLSQKNEWEEGGEILADFLSEHLCVWVYECFHALQTNAISYFYKGVGYLSEDLLSLLVGILDIKPQKRYLYRSGLS